jgi:hypothetical protein
MVFYVIGLAALTAHARYQAHQLAELADAHEIVSIENTAWSVQNTELARDNRDLRWLLGQRPQPENYPASNDPSVDPNPDD